MTELGKAVFLSYASEDAEAAGRIAEGLRAAGIEVWFDQSELRGGDAWDRQIRKQIHDCALFIPVISAHSEARLEGYFRLEWRLAVERSHLMADRKAFLVPVVIDDTKEQDSEVPDSFRAVQWTRLPAGETPPAFIERVQRLLSPHQTPTGARQRTVPAGAKVESSRAAARTVQPRLKLLAIVGVLAVAAISYLAIGMLAALKKDAPSSAPPTPPANTAAGVFAPPPHSIAVLPFVNMSEDKEQEYFSEGLTEEVLNSLARLEELHVAARTSSFSFQGQHPDIATVAHKLNVGAVLEGSVRRAGHTVRITTQLVDGVTGFHRWSQTYDRDLGDVLKLQAEIAQAVAAALKVTLLGDVASKVGLGGTQNPAAFDAYLRASKAYQSVHDEARDIPPAIAAYTEAIRLDPNYALAFAGRSYALATYAGNVATEAGVRENFERAESDARQALTLTPELAEAHMALANVFAYGTLDFARAQEEYQRAMTLAPGNAKVLRESGSFAANMGHFETAIAALRRAVALDPLDNYSHAGLGGVFTVARRYREATTAFTEGISLNPNYKPTYADRGLAFYELGDFEAARSSCETHRDYWLSQECLAAVYEKLGRHADAEAELKKMQAALGDAFAYEYARIYAQWGDHAKALNWLETALRLRDPGLVGLKVAPFLDPLRNEPRFQAIEKALKFPK